jgi:hemerythrin-like domain-containing protein
MSTSGRRLWVRNAGIGVVALVASARAAKNSEERELEVSPAEDLMREHGVLKRVLLVYRDLIRRIDAKEDFPPDVLTGSAHLIRNFVENYHEKLEEDYLFPRFRKANKLVDLVDTLYTQHQKGRVLTDRTLALASGRGQRPQLRETLHLFVRMYEPHEAREDTVLFPAFRTIVSKHEYDSLGEEFERKENQLFGGDGFEKNVAAVAAIEKRLGIYNLAQFTPDG